MLPIEKKLSRMTKLTSPNAYTLKIKLFFQFMKDIWNEIMADTNHSTGSSQDKTNTGQLEGSVEDDGDQESNESAVNREDRGARDISEFDVDGRQALSDFLVDISLHALEGELTQAGITSIRHLARSTLQDLENAGVSFLFQRFV